jgi:hypothetical protein
MDLQARFRNAGELLDSVYGRQVLAPLRRVLGVSLNKIGCEGFADSIFSTSEGVQALSDFVAEIQSLPRSHQLVQAVRGWRALSDMGVMVPIGDSPSDPYLTLRIF